MKKLLITDLDDTLYSWIDFFIPAFYAMVEEISKITGINKEKLIEEYKERHQFYGSVEYPFVTLTLPSIKNKYKGYSENEIKNIFGEAFHKFNSIRKHNLKLFPNVSETLKKLTEMGVTIIGYTESSEENGYYRLKKLGIEPYFKSIYVAASNYESEYPSNSKVKIVHTKKPDKSVLLGICEQEKCDISDAIYIGDSMTKDVYMAIATGITSVWMNAPKSNNDYYSLLVKISSWTEADFKKEKELKDILKNKNLKADYEVTDFATLLDIIEDNNK